MDDTIKILEFVRNEFDSLQLKDLTREEMQRKAYQRAAALDIAVRVLDSPSKNTHDIIENYILEMKWMLARNSHNETLAIILSESVEVAEKLMGII